MVVTTQPNQLWQTIIGWGFKLLNIGLQWFKKQLKTDSVLVNVIAEVVAYLQIWFEDFAARSARQGVDPNEPVIRVMKGDVSRVYAKKKGDTKRTRIE